MFSTNLEVGDFVEMPLPRRVLLGGLEVDLVVDLVPMVDVGHHHPAAGDGDPLVGVPVDHVHLLVPVGREGHGEPPPVLGEEGRLLQLQPAAGGRHDQVVLAVSCDNSMGLVGGETEVFYMSDSTNRCVGLSLCHNGAYSDLRAPHRH